MDRRTEGVLEALIGMVGFLIFFQATDLWAALGLFLALFGNNLGESRRRDA